MQDQVYRLEGTTINYELGFEGNLVYCHLVRRLKETPVNQIMKVAIKKTPMSAGEEISFRIFYTENGTEKKFPWVAALVTTPTTKSFLDDLKSRLNETAVWEDKREQGSIDESGNKVYDLQYLPFGYNGAGLSRSLQIWIYLICLAVLVIPLVYYIYLLSKGGYRIYTNDQGITIRKMRDTHFTWEELEEVDFTRVNVIDRENYSQTEVLKANFIGNNGKSVSCVMRYDHALPLLQELAERDEIPASLLEQFS